ncbi:MAG TPA: ABC transporter permease, partial [Candidatus Sulfotelmatobacter sp.]|nr:ABC transporter permease [Candidatus Sulfotelmatobacter sp.]
TAALPILLLSGVLLPMSIAPQWLQNIAAVNPLLYAVDAARHIFLANLGDPSVAKGVLILAALCVVAVVLGARQFGRAVA